MSAVTHVITLAPEATETRELLAQLQSQGIQAEIFPAVDGRQGMPALQPGERFCRWKALARHKRWLTGAEIGCYLSHLRAIRSAWEAGHEHVCILEDDVCLEPDFARIAEELRADPALELVRFMALRLRPRRIIRPLGDGSHQLVRPLRGTVGTQAYQLNRSGMEKMLAHAACLYEPIDKVLDHFWLFDLNTYLVEPHLVWERPSPSSIARPGDTRGEAGLQHRLAHPFYKLYHSTLRHRYLRRLAAEFTGASMPAPDVGKTPRLH